MTHTVIMIKPVLSVEYRVRTKNTARYYFRQFKCYRNEFKF